MAIETHTHTDGRRYTSYDQAKAAGKQKYGERFAGVKERISYPRKLSGFYARYTITSDVVYLSGKEIGL